MENPILFLPKTENRERNRTETGNRNSHQNRKSEVFCYKSQKTDLKNDRNCKTENPNAPVHEEQLRGINFVTLFQFNIILGSLQAKPDD